MRKSTFGSSYEAILAELSFVANGKDKRPEYLKLMQNELFSLILRDAVKSLVLKINTSDAEYYNSASISSPEGVFAPLSDGHFDVEGYSSVDVNVLYRLDLRQSKDRKFFLENISDWINQLKSISSKKNLTTLKHAIQYAIQTQPFRLDYNAWMFVVDSLGSFRYECAEDMAKIEMGLRGGIAGYVHSLHFGKVYKRAQNIMPNLTHQQLQAYADREYSRVSDSLWVSRQDPTVMIADESILSFDLKDGWSFNKVGEIINYWFREMTGLNPEVICGWENYSETP